jgi:hypothetical protein
MDGVTDPLNVAKGITDYGFLAVAAGFFLVIVFVAIKWFSKIISKEFTENSNNLSKLLSITEQFYNLLKSMKEDQDEMKFEDIKAILEWAFNNSCYEVIEATERINRFNNLKDNEDETREKLEKLIKNMANKRANKFDLFTYNGKTMAYYTERSEWRDMLVELIMKELYHKDGYNSDRAKVNIKLAYDGIKSDYINNLKNQVIY